MGVGKFGRAGGQNPAAAEALRLQKEKEGVPVTFEEIMGVGFRHVQWTERCVSSSSVLVEFVLSLSDPTSHDSVVFVAARDVVLASISKPPASETDRPGKSFSERVQNAHGEVMERLWAHLSEKSQKEDHRRGAYFKLTVGITKGPGSMASRFLGAIFLRTKIFSKAPHENRMDDGPLLREYQKMLEEETFISLTKLVDSEFLCLMAILLLNKRKTRPLENLPTRSLGEIQKSTRPAL